MKKSIKLILKTNKFSSLMNFNNRNYVLFESDSKFTLEYLKHNNSQTFPLSLNTIAKKYKNNKTDTELQEASEKLINVIMENYQNLINKYRIAPNKDVNDYLHKFLKRIFIDSIHYYSIFKSYLKNMRPINLFIGSNNTMILRAFSAAVKDNNGSVNTFTHGEPLVYEWDKIGWMEFSLANNYFEYTDTLAKSIEKTLDKTPYNQHIKIKSCNTKSFNLIKKNTSERNVLDNSIMFIANEYIRPGQLSQVSSFPNLIQMDFEIKLMRYLSKKYKIVYYKKHPGGILGNKKINFFPENVKIIEEPFEQVLDITDSMIFGHSKTTAIGPALASNKKIILFTGKWEKFEKSVYNMLNQQIYILEYSTKKNKISFNEKELGNLLIAKNKKMEYYDNYLKVLE